MLVDKYDSFNIRLQVMYLVWYKEFIVYCKICFKFSLVSRKYTWMIKCNNSGIANNAVSLPGVKIIPYNKESNNSI